MSSENHQHPAPATTFPRSSTPGPNLATLDRLRSLRRPRLLPSDARRHAAPRECAAR